MTCYGIWGRDWDGIAATGLRELYWRWHNGYHSMFMVNRSLKLELTRRSTQCGPWDGFGSTQSADSGCGTYTTPIVVGVGGGWGAWTIVHRLFKSGTRGIQYQPPSYNLSRLWSWFYYEALAIKLLPALIRFLERYIPVPLYFCYLACLDVEIHTLQVHMFIVWSSNTKTIPIFFPFFFFCIPNTH